MNNSFNSTPVTQYTLNKTLKTLFCMLAFLFLYACTVTNPTPIPSSTNTHKVTFDLNKPNGVTAIISNPPSEQTVDDNATATAPTTLPTLTGYTFGGWYTDASTTTEFLFSTKITKATTLYAKWTAKPTFTVTYNVNKPTGATADVTVVPDAVMIIQNQMATEPPSPALDGYTFAGWYSDQATATVFEFTTAITENITLYAKWTAKPIFTVTYNVNKPTTATADVTVVPNSVMIIQNQMATEPPSPALDGYTFAGWYSDQATTTVFEFTTAIAENITLYAKWTAKPTFTVTYNVNKPTTATADVTVVPDAAMIIQNQMATAPPSPALDGYTFAGWYSDQATTTVFEFTTAITENITLYAKWTTKPIFTVTYNINKPTTATAEVTVVPNAAMIIQNQMATAPPSPALDGYTFDGWYSDQATATVFEFSTAITENITLYAKWTAKPIFTVTYNVNKPTTATADVTVVPDAAMIIQNQMATEPPSPALDGYTFAGWYSDQATTSVFAFSTAITEDIILYAKWTAKPIFTVSYNVNKPTTATADVTVVPDAVMIIQNQMAIEPPSPALDGYTFDGWYYDQATTRVFAFSTAITENITLYAKWTAKPIFTVSYNVNKPTTATADVTVVPNAAMIIQNQMAIEPPSPALEGYTFDGWYYEQATTSVFEFSTAITENITLYAKWTAKPTFTVTYNVNKPTTATADITVVPNSAMIIQNQMATKPPSPALDGYTFDGWYSDQATTSVFEFSTAITENITLYAKWTAKPIFTVTYNVNKPTTATADVTVVPNSAMIIQDQMATEPPSPALDGYTFDGWYSDQATTAVFEFTRTAITENITLYAKWTAKPIFTVSYNVNKPTTATADVTVVPNSAMIIQDQMATEPPSPALEGYTFDGWYYEQATTAVFEFTRTAITENITLYAKWTAKPIFTVSYNVNKPTTATADVTVVPNAAMIIQNQMATAPPSPALDGYTFDGWYSDQATATVFEFSTAITENITLYAKWTAKPIFTVTYNVNKPTTATADVTVVPNSAMIIQDQMATEPPSPALDGYTFDGWYSDQATTAVFEFTRTAITENITLYAKWTAKPIFTVSYNVNKPTTATADVTVVPNSAMIIQDQMATEPPSPALEGYTFDGWYYEQATTTAFEFTRTAITENITLYAKWTAKPIFTVSYNANKPTGAPSTDKVTGLPNSEMIINNQMATEPTSSVPMLVGYTFDGWYSDQATTRVFEFTRTAITEDIILYAKWTPTNAFIVVFNVNKPTTATADVTNVPNLVRINVNLMATAPTDPALDGYTFAGWYSDQATTRVFEFTRTAITEDIILYAKWLFRPETKAALVAEINRAITTTMPSPNLNYIDTSLINDMSGLFDGKTNFNGNISSWNVSRVTDMSFMFSGVNGFNIDISGWNVSLVQDMSSMFNQASNFNQDLNNWNVSLVEDMSNMFNGARFFNGNISSWNVSKVADMGSMFSSASAFNQNISSWNVSKVTNMITMFLAATAFNQNISSWNVDAVTTFGAFGSASGLSVENTPPRFRSN